MIMPSCSIRTLMAVIVALMGLLGLLLAVSSGELYNRLAFENQRKSLVELVRIEANALLKSLQDNSRDLGLALQRDKNFRKAIITNDIASLENYLNNQFHQYFVTAGVIRLEKLVLFNTNFSLLAESTERTSLPTGVLVCPELVNTANKREGSQRLRVIADTCLAGDYTYHAVIVPVGGLRPQGYIQIISDPSHSLRNIEKALGFPTRITTGQNIQYLSEKWPTSGNTGNSLAATYVMNSGRPGKALTISVRQDISPLNNSINQTRLLVMLVASVITLAAALLALWVLRRTSLNPLSLLTKQLQKLQSDRSTLGEQVEISGVKEVQELAKSFNMMTAELKTLYHTLEHMAFTDQLTKLPNRNLFHERLADFSTGEVQALKPFALLLMDLDRFKVVNDTLGHHVGDQILQQVGSRLQNALRDSDLLARIDESSIAAFDNGSMVARLGGDEFSAILPNTDNTDSAETVAQKLLQAMEPPFTIGDHSIVIHISIGITLFPEHGTDMHTLMQKADVAMYHAKQLRRGYAFYERTQRRYDITQLTLERDLQNAFTDEAQLIPYYQPMVNLQTSTLCGVEALLYWHHPVHGLLGPDEFIPLAEQTGLIGDITHTVLRKALRDCSQWQADGLPLCVSVNLSPENLHDGKIVSLVESELEKCSVPAHMLVLELTESAVMWDPYVAIESLKKLDNMGVKLSIDDFGTGYSSLTLLKQLPVDHIKIDRIFIKELVSNTNDEAIVISTIVLAHHMGLTVIAEGVEDMPAWNRLKTAGCDIAQGYLITAPLAIDDFRQWLTETEWRLSDDILVNAFT